MSPLPLYPSEDLYPSETLYPSDGFNPVPGRPGHGSGRPGRYKVLVNPELYAKYGIDDSGARWKTFDSVNLSYYWSMLHGRDDRDGKPIFFLMQELAKGVYRPVNSKELNTIAELKAVFGSGLGGTALVLGKTVAGDGEGGIYYWDVISEAIEDLINVVKPNNGPATGRWILWSSLLNVVDDGGGGGGGGDVDVTEMPAPVFTSVNRTMQANEYMVVVDATSGPVTISLPSATAISGKEYAIKKVDGSANAVTIDPSGAQTVDADAAPTLNTQFQSVIVQSDGGNWRIVAGLV